MWSSIFGETHSYCLLGVYVIYPVWESSFVGLGVWQLTWQYKGTKVKSKSFVFEVIQVMMCHCVNRPIRLWTSLISIQRSVCRDQSERGARISPKRRPSETFSVRNVVSLKCKFPISSVRQSENEFRFVSPKNHFTSQKIKTCRQSETSSVRKVINPKVVSPNL